MRYLVSFIIPPLGILMCGRWVHAIVNLLLWISSVFLIPVFGLGFFVWIACIIYALAICKMSSADKRLNRMIEAIKETRSPTVQ